MSRIINAALSVALSANVITARAQQVPEAYARPPTLSVDDPRGTVINAINFHAERDGPKTLGEFEVPTSEMIRATQSHRTYVFVVLKEGARQCTSRSDLGVKADGDLGQNTLQALMGKQVFIPVTSQLIAVALAEMNRQEIDGLIAIGCVAIPIGIRGREGVRQEDGLSL